MRLRLHDLEVVDLDQDGDRDLVGLLRRRLVYQENRGGRYRPPVVLARFHSGRKIAVADADGNRRKDVYVLTKPFARQPSDFILMATRRRLRFVKVGVPPAEGEGSDVLPLRIGRRRHAFLVLNGGGLVKGPTQLIAVFR